MGSEAANTEAVDAQLSHIARSGVFNLLGAAVSAVFGFGLIVVVTQLYDQATAGMFFAASSAFLILLGAASLGTESGLARFMLRYEATGRTADISQCLSVALRPVLLISLVLALGTALLAGQLAPLIGLDTPQGSLVLLMFALLLPVAAWGDFFVGRCPVFRNGTQHRPDRQVPAHHAPATERLAGCPGWRRSAPALCRMGCPVRHCRRVVGPDLPQNASPPRY
ncbi:lipopolysaccharide biosynthesis protein [Arthrobacter sp. SA17]